MVFQRISGTELAPEELQRHVLSTYLRLRMGIGIIGVAFPFVLWLGGYLYAQLPLQDAMSDYYWAMNLINGRSMRDWFVGPLFALGIALYLYKGFGRAENWALNVAGAMAALVAVIPESASKSRITPHGFCATTLFLCMAFVAIFCAEDTLELINDTDIRNPRGAIARLKLTYKLIGYLMIGAMVAVYVLNLAHKAHHWKFWVEAGGVLPFGAYWLVKSWELRRTAAELKTVRGQTKKRGGRVIKIGD